MSGVSGSAATKHGIDGMAISSSLPTQGGDGIETCSGGPSARHYAGARGAFSRSPNENLISIDQGYPFVLKAA